MAKLIDLTGQRFGKLTVLNRCESTDKRKSPTWECQCDCGNKTKVVGTSLTRKIGTESCGCLSKKHFVDLTGQKFNNLTVIRYLGKDNTKNNMYECQCDCGNKIHLQGSDVKTGKVKACGCRQFGKQIQDAKALGNEPLYKNLFAQYKQPGKRDYEFHLEFDDFRKLVDQPCHYCGAEPTNVMKDKRSYGERMIKYNGLDRINNDIGYTKENVVPCCRSCNISKHTYSIEFFEEQTINRYNMIMKRRNESK